ncbi:transposable element Tcb2 transposase, partial [Trichonephila clavipes]
IGKGFLKVLLAKPDANLEIIPVDVVANAHIIAAYSVANGRYSSPFVLNCAPYDIPIRLTNMVPMLLKLVNKYPVPNGFRYSNNVWIVDNKTEKTLLSIFEHYIPAAGIDLMLILQGKKPKLFSLYRFLDRVMDVSAPFLSRQIEFATENFRDLKNAVSPEKAEQFFPPPFPHLSSCCSPSEMADMHWCAKIEDEVEKLTYQLNEEAERTERPIRRLRTAIWGFSSGRPRGTTPADDRYIVLQARRNRRQTAGEIARHTTQATGRPISRFTVARRLHGGGLFARRPVRCVPLTPAHRRRRSLWCREHRNWRDNEWGRILFTEERRFSLSSDSHRILIWRERGSRNHPSNIIERDRGSMGLQFLFMDDNAPCHRTVAAEQLLESEDIERMDWTARSPDLNPIEHVREFLGRRLAARTLPPVTIGELRLALQDEWAAMPQQLIDTLILSMGRRCETCLEELYTDIGGLNVEEFVDQLSGAPQYDWALDKKTKAQRLKLINRIYYFTIFIQVLSIFLLFWASYAAFCQVAHLPFRN